MAISLRKTAISIILFVVCFIVEWIVGIVISVNVSAKAYLYFPLNVFSKLTPNPLTPEFNQIGAMQKPPQPPDPQLAMSTNVMMSLGLMIVLFGISYFILRKRDL